MQSHVVRLPLANIIGLSNIIREFNLNVHEREVFDNLDYSIKQLDHIIRDIVGHANDA